jgi:hypothetical protein
MTESDHIESRVSVLETRVALLEREIGDNESLGLQGRVGRLSERVDGIRDWMLKIIGGATVIGAIVELVHWAWEIKIK